MFKNKVALVTGSSRGIRKSIIKELASKNCNVVINYNKSEKEAKELEQYIKENYNVKCISIKCDISNEEEVKNMTKEIIEEFGYIDILVNNAAIEINNNFEDKTKDDFQKILDINVIGTFLVSKYISKYMLEKGSGKIINITSNNAINKYDPSTLEYDASKAAIISLTHNLAIQFAPIINVNAIAPGWIMTENVKKLDDSLDGMLQKEETKNILLSRFAQPEELAKLVSFLASNDANYINNQIITIDGGTR